jgi:hypothetical protein
VEEENETATAADEHASPTQPAAVASRPAPTPTVEPTAAPAAAAPRRVAAVKPAATPKPAQAVARLPASRAAVPRAPVRFAKGTKNYHAAIALSHVRAYVFLWVATCLGGAPTPAPALEAHGFSDEELALAFAPAVAPAKKSTLRAEAPTFVPAAPVSALRAHAPAFTPARSPLGALRVHAACAAASAASSPRSGTTSGAATPCSARGSVLPSAPAVAAALGAKAPF